MAINKVIYDISGEEIVDNEGHVTVYSVDGVANRVNKVVYGERTLIDISDTEAEQSDVALGTTFYLANGQKVTGTKSGSTVDTGSDAAINDDTIELTEGGSINLQSKTVTPTKSTQNVTPDSGYDGLSQVTVNPISSEYIVPSGSQTITENDTYDVTSLASVIVNVGGQSSWKKLGETDLTVSTTSTSAASAGTINCGSEASTKAKIIYVRVRDKAGKRAGYYLGSDAYFMNTNKANGSTSAFTTPAVVVHRYTTSSQYGTTAGQYGVYGYSISNAGVVTIRRRYNSNYSLTIDGTYHVEVYALDYPDGISPFDI